MPDKLEPVYSNYKLELNEANVGGFVRVPGLRVEN
jgi:hypothetical protein